jgi:putative NADH-flavin reductase
MTKPLKVAVIGPTGYGGSHTCIELLSRGHHVTGLSRNPAKIGTHPNYTPHSIDMENASITEIIEVFKGHDVIVKYTNPKLP